MNAEYLLQKTGRVRRPHLTEARAASISVGKRNSGEAVLIIPHMHVNRMREQIVDLPVRQFQDETGEVSTVLPQECA